MANHEKTVKNMKKLEKSQMDLLGKLLAFSDRYEINIQFWPEQTVVYIYKDGIDLQDYGGSFVFAVTNALNYLNRINQNLTNNGKCS